MPRPARHIGKTPCVLCEKRQGEEAGDADRAHRWPHLPGSRTTVRQNVFLRDMNVNVCADDARQIEVLAQDLPCYGGVQLAVEVTLRSVLTCEGEAHAHAADMDGAMLVKARTDKETAYPELATSGRCKLIVMAIETGGRWSEESVDVLRELSHAKAQEAPSFMRFQGRWTRMLGVTCATAFAASLVEPAAPPLLVPYWRADPSLG